ncbi:excinuclease ABC subunit UvrA, partial [Klebsiella pneumoniae]|nr:excinuclease ABC subunit UvrA [Klebsiella pneumoniae]
ALPDESKLMLLAPVVRDRKGEFVELFQDLQAQGYVRFRVDGATMEVPDLPALKKAEKHDIDVVIDRIKLRHDAADQLRQRLAESFEAALRLADGRALVMHMDS